jgi:hypothetical protein
MWQAPPGENYCRRTFAPLIAISIGKETHSRNSQLLAEHPENDGFSNLSGENYPGLRIFGHMQPQQPWPP